MNPVVKIIIAILVALFGVGGLLMTLCGGAFTVMGVSEPSGQILLLSIGSMVVGLLSMWGAYKYFTITKLLDPDVIAAKAAQSLVAKPAEEDK